MKKLPYLLCHGSLMKSARYMAIFVFSLILTLRASALVYVVNTTNDTHALLPGTGTGLDAGGNVSLRSALEDADALGGVHSIILGSNTYTLVLGEITFGNTAENITITGNGPAATIIDMTLGATRDRIFFVNPSGTTNGVVLNVTGVTFQNGYLTSDPYGGAAICAGGGAANALTVTNCAFINNIVPLGNGTGGAINQVISGDLTVNNCSFTNNQDQDSEGGAIYFLVISDPSYSGNLVVNGSTFTGNSVSNGASGGAISFSATGDVDPGLFSVSIQKSTFLNNSANSGIAGAILGNTSYGLNGIVNINYNRFKGNTSAFAAAGAVARFGGTNGTINATNNWWACNTGPTGGTCDRATTVGSPTPGALTTSPWLQLKADADDIFQCPGENGTTEVTAGFLSNSANAPVSPTDLDVLIGQPISFVNPVLGTLSGADPVIQPSGTASVTFTSNGTLGAASVNAVVDNVPGNDPVAKASFNVNGDGTPPTITCPGPVTVQCASMVPAPNTASVTATDNNTPNPTITWEGDVISNQTCANRYTITRTYKASDGCGNSATCTQTITVFDNTAPVATAGTINSCYATAAAAEAAAIAATSATDNCGGTVTKTASTSGTCTAVVVVTATDECGNFTNVTYQTRIDATAPVITASGVPANGTLGCNPTAAEIEAALGTATANDNCDGDLSGSMVVTTSPVSSSGCTRSQTRTWTVSDACGNPAQAQRTATWSVVTAPVLAGVPSGGDLGCNPTPPSCNGGVTASNECGSVPVTCTAGPVISNGCNRTQTFTYTATDACSNLSTSQTVTYSWKVVTAPVLANVPAGGSLGCNPTTLPTCSNTVTASNECGSVPVTCTAGPVTSNGCNRTQVFTYTATDACSGLSTSQSVTYTWQIVTAPVITNLPIITYLGCNPTPPSCSNVTASNECGPVPVTCVSTPVVAIGCSRLQLFCYTATDPCSGLSKSEFVIYVWLVVTAPVLHNVPAGGNLGCNPSSTPGCSNSVTASNECCDVPVTCTAGAIVTNGCNRTRVVTYTATDECSGLSTTQSVTYTWKVDVTQPTITCPANQTVNPTSLSGAVVTYSTPTATDNCGISSVTRTAGPASGSLFPIGTTTVTYKATDVCGNTKSCSFTVTVRNPSCGSNKSYVCHNGHTICVSNSSVNTHLGHGDQLGQCSWYSSPRMITSSEEEVPEAYKLSNFPNPFSNQTIIRFELPVESRISIVVYDMMGKQIATVISGERKAGVYFEEFDASKLPGGMYVYKFVAEANGKLHSQTGKLSVIR